MRFRLVPDSFGNTFGHFCFPRVLDALLGNVSRTFRFTRVRPDTHGRHYLPFPLLKNHPVYARQPAPHFGEAYSLISGHTAFQSVFSWRLNCVFVEQTKKRPGANALGLNRYVCLKTRLDYFLKVTDTSASS